MTLRCFISTATMLALAQTETALAQRAAQVPVQGNQWIVDYGDYRCTLGRRFSDARSPLFVLSSYLGRDEPEIVIVRDGTEPLPDLPRRVGIVLTPGDRREEARTAGYQTERGRAIRIEGIAEGFFDRFSTAETVTIETGGREALTLRTPGARRAIEALRACNDDLLRSWGVDVAARASYTRQAKIIGGSINSNDYPAAALRANQSGIVVARMRVGPDGRAGECVVVRSSRSEPLDAATCALATSRFRFEPALDAQGAPVTETYIQTVRWLLPQ